MRRSRNYYSKKNKDDFQLAVFITVIVLVIIGYFATHPKVVTMIKQAFVITLAILAIGISIYVAMKFLSKDTRENATLKDTKKQGQINTKEFLQNNQFSQIEIKINNIKKQENSYIDQKWKEAKEKRQQEIIEAYSKINEEPGKLKKIKYQAAKTETKKIRKGKEYEYDVKCFFEQRNYKVYPNGYINGVKDEGIDLIAYKEDEAILAQCKNWINPPKQDIIKKFVADADLFINKNQSKFKNKRIRKIFFTSCRQMDYGAKIFLEEYNQYNQIKIEYVIYAA
ncbi:MAG: hypothetical protein ACTTJF_02645 [Campylobacter sp.]|uniref:hypothetical protein n=1 Tax=Campylobacter sp. TaxID=205 RepID=UPI003FA0F52D